MIPTYRVSHLAAYARWKDEEGDSLSWLAESIFGSQQSEAMRRGTAFHTALEKIGTGEFSTVSADGFTFAFTCDAEVTLPKTREIRMFKDYGGIIVTGKCDAIAGRVIDDHKTTSQFDAQDHLDGWQHKFYMDIFEADVFRWHGWVMSAVGDGSDYNVREYHKLIQYRYPGMEEDCRGLAQEFRDFAEARGWKGINIGQAA